MMSCEAVRLSSQKSMDEYEWAMKVLSEKRMEYQRGLRNYKMRVRENFWAANYAIYEFMSEDNTALQVTTLECR